MRGHLARRLHREAHACRPDPSPALQERIRAAIVAEPSTLAAAQRRRLQPGGWLAIQACAVVALAVITFAVVREPATAPVPGTGAAFIVTADTAPPPPFEDLLAALGNEVRGMAAALIGMPDWNGNIDVESTLALLAPPPDEEP